MQHPGTYVQLLHTVTTQIKASFCTPSPKKGRRHDYPDNDSFGLTRPHERKSIILL
jgi:hypothetical protein